MKFLSKLLSRRVLFLFQMIVTIIFGYAIYKLNMIPMKFFIPLIVILLIVFILLYKGQKSSNEHPVKPKIYKIVSLLLSIVMIFGSIKIMQGSNMLDVITGADTQVIEYSVVSMKESTYDSIADLENLKFGACLASDPINTNKTKSLIEEDIGTISLDDYSTTNDASKALYNQEIDAMILKEIDRDALNDTISDFDDKTKVIETYKLRIPSAKANKAKVTQEPFNIFIGGTDQKGDISTAGLSDVNMIATVNPVTKQLYLTSVPRDYYVDIDGYNGKDKLTHSARSSEGINCTMKTIENFMGIKFNYYVKLNFTSFMNIIDAIGGVDIDIPEYKTKNGDGTFTTKIYKYNMKPGKTHMDAKHALAYVRERKSFIDGDRIRGQNQQIMIKAIVKKICTPAIVTKLDGIFESVADSLETNMSSEEVRSLINMEMDDLAPWDVLSYHLNGNDQKVMDFATIAGPCPNPNGLYVMIPDETTIVKAKGYIDTIMSGELLKIEDDE